VDLIFGLPESVPRDWEADLEQAVALGATHVSAYGLTAESATPLGRRVAAGREAMPGEDAYEAEFLAASRVLSLHGFTHYEVSNFAKPGHESRHNWHYWIGTSYLGLGPSSHSYVGDERIWNVRSWPAYRRAAEEGSSLRAGRERPDPAARRLEALWLGLRTRRGISPPVSEAAARRIRRWTDAGWARIDADGRLRLTPRGWLRMDAIVAELDQPRSRREFEEPEPLCGGAEAR
jgi:oxygen-independent coproporphyrinogen-3 oxidase